MNDKTEMPQEAARPKRKFGPSTVARLQVARVSEMGAFLDAQTGNTSDDILLHKTQQTHPVAVGDLVDVFPRDGAFLDVGAERGIFMPYAGMRGRPQVGEVVWAKLYTDKSGRLAVTMEVEDEMRRASKPATHVKVGQMVTGAIYNYTDAGAFLFSNERYIVFIANKEMKEQERPRVGQIVTARVTFVRSDGRLNASLREAKEKALVTDSSRILELLESRKGRMPYSDETSPEVIRDKFQISKAAFKRALGHLMKEGRVAEKDGWTYLLDVSAAADSEKSEKSEKDRD